MTKHIVTPFFAALFLAVSACHANAQNCAPCGQSSFPSYQQFCIQNYGNSCLGQNIFTDKTVRPFNRCMSTCSDPCGFSGCMGGCVGNGCLCGSLSRLLGRNVNCAGPDFGYTYTPGYGANGQGLAPGWGGAYSANRGPSGLPSYTYRSPRDFLNPNPPSIGY